MAQGFETNRRFFDDANYPQGFSRSGDFTIQESSILENFGAAFKELEEGKRTPATKDEEHFLKVCHGEAEAEMDEERVWMKYKKSITTQKKLYTVFSKRAAADSETYERDRNRRDAPTIDQ
ncbi:DUF413 domain-containing protein [Algicola sagamiensis]|uniref:DUF413 domain-containing protein n=1 Tax=Algicola sagamiensis TaxID=163869 RepID=UPI00035E91E9|nr:DUF413 domain-containing protein [Algicola sagamiensis]